ncbi:MAG: TonB-dependent receptor [Rhodothermales bacterium]|nr:TonB-dependent receptor [Rhodothermales bacterium]MBO6778446.1 TonB-dependent receptor [Rhodothermales bacterium]
MKPLSLLLGLLLAMPVSAQTISGTVTDEDGVALIGASVLVQGTTIGAVTDTDGAFQLDYMGAFPVTLEVSYIGYRTAEISIAAATTTLRIQLAEQISFGPEVVVSASRRPEKLQEAPAAVAVLTDDELSASGGTITPLRALINTPGVELQQQTGQRINLALRGSSGIFSTDVFPMLDYRSLISPGLEFFDSQNSPINNIDLERIEVVLGPGSALYGPDVTTGVVHFISKDPFRHPGTTVEVVGGEKSTLKGAIRHAGVTGDERIGYKFNARYSSGHDFVLQPDNEDDARVLSNFKEAIRRGFVTPEGFVDPQQEGPLLFTTTKEQEEDYWAAMATGTVHFRPNPDTELVGAGGWNAASSIFYNDLGEGFNHSNEYWGQARLTHKGLFAQTYYVINDGGSDENPVYLNRTGLIVPLERTHFEAQAQYSFETPSLLNAEWSTGLDYRTAGANTENHVYGRNEDDDDYRIFGGYVQSKLRFGSKLDAFLAGRVDSYNFTDEKTFSPRAALVFKPNGLHSVRLSYNRAANPIPASDIYFDLPVQTESILNVWNMGGIRPQTFTDPMITWLIPGVDDTPFDQGFPLAAAYAAVNDAVIPQLQAQASADPSLAPFVPALVNLLQSGAPQGFSRSLISTDFNVSELLPVSAETKLISQLTAYEFGYKGLFFDRFAAGFDVYYFRKDAAGGFSQVSPIITMLGLPADLGNGVQETFQPQIEALLLGAGVPAADAAAQAAAVGALLNGAYTQAGESFMATLDAMGLPFHGLVESDQVPDTGFPMLAFGYPTRNPDAVSDDWGFEVHTRYYFSEALSAFANYTWFNRPTGMAGDLNFPQNKVRTGVGYAPAEGLRASASFAWDQAYRSNNSTYPGRIEARSLLDASVGYGLDNGVTVELSGTNLLDNTFRSLPGFPQIGRRVVARVVYDF